MIEIRTWDDRYAALQAQQNVTALLCRGLKVEKGKSVGFSQHQYDAALKTLELATELFSPETKLSAEQLETTQKEILCSHISAKLMYQDLEQQGIAPDAKRYRAISLIAAERLKQVDLKLGLPPEQFSQLLVPQEAPLKQADLRLEVSPELFCRSPVPQEAPSYWCQIL